MHPGRSPTPRGVSITLRREGFLCSPFTHRPCSSHTRWSFQGITQTVFFMRCSDAGRLPVKQQPQPRAALGLLVLLDRQEVQTPAARQAATCSQVRTTCAQDSHVCRTRTHLSHLLNLKRAGQMFAASRWMKRIRENAGRSQESIPLGASAQEQI